MTTIAAYISRAENRVYMASDTCGANDSYKEQRRDPKIIQLPRGSGEIPRMLIGVAGSIPVIQNLTLSTIILPNDSNWETMLNFVNDNIRPVIEATKETYPGEEDDFYFEIIMAFGTRMFTVQYNMALGELAGDFNAIGTGRDYAIGAMWAIKKSFPESYTMSGRDFVTIAVEAAINNDLKSGGVVDVKYV